jgi:hydrogenase maturation factor
MCLAVPGRVIECMGWRRRMGVGRVAGDGFARERIWGTCAM